MAGKAKAIPEGFTTLTPHMVVKGADKAIAFYKKAFGAEEIMRMPDPTGKICHAELKIGNSVLMMCEEFPQPGCAQSPQTIKGTAVTLHLYVENVDAAFKKAVDAGATAVMPPAEMFWGDRYSKVTDPFGHMWSIATHTKDVTPQECAKAAEAFFAQMAGKH